MLTVALAEDPTGMMIVPKARAENRERVAAPSATAMMLCCKASSC